MIFLKNYGPCDVAKINNLKHLISYAKEKYGDKTAFSYERDKVEKSESYKKLAADIEALGTYFSSVGESGDRIAVYGENSYEWIITYFAAVNSGRVIVPIDKELDAESVSNLINDCGAILLVYGKTKKKVVEELKETGIPSVNNYICVTELGEFVLKGKAMLEDGNTSYADFEPDMDKMCSIIYTSGTTGKPKGVMLSQGNLTYDMWASSATLFIPENTTLVLPLHHTFGFTAGVLCMIHRGYSVYINSSLKSILPDINKSKPGHISLVPLFVEKFYKSIWKNAEKTGKAGALKKLIAMSNSMRKIGIDLRPVLFKTIRNAFGGNLSMLISGGAPIDNLYMKGFDDFGIQVVNGYGITECSPIVSINRNKYYRFGSVGVPILDTEVKIINPDDDGEGEILVKGPHVMLGYYNNPEATEAAFIDGWFNTGDIGKIDEDGFIFITGRKKNIIVLSNGKNVYPEEIETEFLKIPYVDEVVVFGRDDLLCAEIYTETLDKKDEIRNQLRVVNEKFPSYKQVKHIEFRDTEFEKTTTKKIKRVYN